MHRVTYSSRALIREDKLDEELDALVRKAAEHNAAHNITGALLLLADNFIQVIEGDRVPLHALLA